MQEMRSKGFLHTPNEMQRTVSGQNLSWDSDNDSDEEKDYNKLELGAVQKFVHFSRNIQRQQQNQQEMNHDKDQDDELGLGAKPQIRAFPAFSAEQAKEKQLKKLVIS